MGFNILFTNREVSVRCSAVGDKYACTIHHGEKNSIDTSDKNLRDIKAPLWKTDDEVLQEYLDNVLRRRLNLLYRNSVAFPACASFPARTDIKTFLLKGSRGDTQAFSDLIKYCRDHGCLKGSIITANSLKDILKSIKFAEPNDNDDDDDNLSDE